MNKKIKQIKFLLGEDSRLLIGLLGLFLIASLFDLIGLGLIGPYISVISGGTEFLSKFDTLFSYKEEIGDANFLGILSICLAVAFLAKAIIGLWVNKKLLDFSANQEVRLRAKLLSSYQNMPYSDFMASNSTDYLYTIQTLTSQFSTNILMPALKMMSEGIVVFCLLFFLGWVNIFALLLMFLLLIGMLYGYDLFTRKIIMESGRASILANASALKAAKEGILGFKEIRILGKETFFYNRLLSKSVEYVTNQVRATLLSNAPRYMLELVLVLFIVILVLSTSFFLGDMKGLLPTLAVFGFAAMRLMPAAYSCSYGISQIRHGSNCIDVLYEQLFKFNNEKDNNLVSNHCKDFQSIELRNVSFKYLENTNLVLEGASIIIKKGEAIAMIGASGAGKSTAIDLLLGLLKPTSGEVLYNGQPLEQNLPCWNRQVAYLPQQAFLLDESLRLNITLEEGCDAEKNTRYSESIEKSRLLEIVSNMPDGSDSVVGESGTRLSGGQRQRVAIARALYHARDVIIMDESTSSLDGDTENEIIEEIKLLKGRKTIIVIAHRMSTVRYCDRIYSVGEKSISSISHHAIK